MTDPQKRCSHCQQVLPLADFGRAVSQPGGLDFYCRVCRRGARDRANQRLSRRNNGYLPARPAVTRAEDEDYAALPLRAISSRPDPDGGRWLLLG